MSISTPEEARTRLLTDLSARISKSRHVLFTPSEMKSKNNLTEEEWYERTNGFLENPENEIPNAGLIRDLVRGLLTQRFAPQLGRLTVAKFATLIHDFPPPKKYKGL